MVKRLVKICVIGFVALWLLTFLTLVLPVPRDQVQRLDAIVVLAGENSRLPTGVALAERNVAPVLVISNGNAKGWEAANDLCRSHLTFRVVCPKPSSDDTQGEARTIAALARKSGWRHIVIVSSNYHLRRARTLFHRCFTGEIRVYASNPSRFSVGTWFGAFLEWPKSLRAAIDRDC